MKLPALDHILHLVRTEKRLFVRFGLASLGRAGLSMATLLLIQEFLAGVLGQSGGLAARFVETFGTMSALILIAALLVLAYFGASLLYYDVQVVQQRVVKVLELGVMERLIRHLLSLSLGFYGRLSHGDLIQAVREDVSRLRAVVTSYARIFLEGTQAVALGITAVYLSPSLTFWSLLVLPLATLPILWVARRTLLRSYEVRRTGFRLFDVILQLLRGIRVIKVYHGEDAEARSAVERGRAYFDSLIEMVRVESLAQVALETVAGLSIVIVVIAGGLKVLAGSLEWPTLLAFLLAVRQLHGPLQNVNQNYIQIQRFGASVERLGQLLDERPEVVDASDARPLTAAPSRIALENVGFSYDTTPVLRNISIQVEAGETLGIAGPSGAGKTTLLNLVARFFDPTEGALRFDGEDLRRFRLADVYAQIALVPQEPFLFSATVRENIRCGRPKASDEDVEAAARAAEIHEEILELRQGYDTLLGTGGRIVSAGQAQRINVARALLKNAPILLLDEATSSLDSIAEAKVQRAIDRLVAGRTTFVVAHRLSTLRNADRILVLGRGQAVGLGTHRELLRDCPLYERMWRTQELGGSVAEAREP